MGKQWHPAFAYLLNQLVRDYYEVQPEVPVSDLPRRGDLLVLSRQQESKPPFAGLWSHLTPWNVLELKGPTDAPEEDDLELLLHVGTGLAYRLNEERRQNRLASLAAGEMSFWYLTPVLGDTFWGQAQLRAAFTLEERGLWRARVWGHPVWLVCYRDLAVEVDTVPLHLLGPEPAARSVGEVLLGSTHLLQRYASWLYTFQPELWKEIRQMASQVDQGPTIQWDKLREYADLREVIPHIPPDQVIECLGVEKAVATIGLERVLAVVGLPKVIAAVGLSRLLEVYGRDKALKELLESSPPDQLQDVLAHLPADLLQEALRRQQP
jgi:hypothetical protein